MSGEYSLWSRLTRWLKAPSSGGLVSIPEEPGGSKSGTAGPEAAAAAEETGHAAGETPADARDPGRRLDPRD